MKLENKNIEKNNVLCSEYSWNTKLFSFSWVTLLHMSIESADYFVWTAWFTGNETQVQIDWKWSRKTNSMDECFRPSPRLRIHTAHISTLIGSDSTLKHTTSSWGVISNQLKAVPNYHYFTLSRIFRSYTWLQACRSVLIPSP